MADNTRIDIGVDEMKVIFDDTATESETFGKAIDALAQDIEDLMANSNGQMASKFRGMTNVLNKLNTAFAAATGRGSDKANNLIQKVQEMDSTLGTDTESSGKTAGEGADTDFGSNFAE